MENLYNNKRYLLKVLIHNKGSTRNTYYMKFGTSDSAFPTDGMYRLIVQIINEHVGNK